MNGVNRQGIKEGLGDWTGASVFVFCSFVPGLGMEVTVVWYLFSSCCYLDSVQVR